MKRIIIILLAVLTIDASASSILQGYVLNKNDSTALVGATVRIMGTNKGAIVKEKDGSFKIVNIPEGTWTVKATFVGKIDVEKKISDFSKIYTFYLEQDTNANTNEIMVIGSSSELSNEKIVNGMSGIVKMSAEVSKAGNGWNVRGSRYPGAQVILNGTLRHSYFGGTSIGNLSNSNGSLYMNESYNEISFNKFSPTLGNPLSSFSADVDRASYSNIRRMITNGQQVEKDAVKIEEMINYFNYDYESPENEKFKVITEYSECPWNNNNTLLKIALKCKDIPKDDLPPSHLVFLLDVSGSMQTFNKLPLIKSSILMLLEKLDDDDRISIVTYAGSEKIVCENIPCSRKQYLHDIINNLEASGSTNAGSGIKTAYNIAEQYYIKNGNNRVILATDGDFNVGITRKDDLEKLITTKRDKNIYLSCLGFGMGNYKDDNIETLSQHGNGNYAYIDNLLEAKKQLVTEIGSTLFTVAKDVKLQLEFNPYYVNSYRLIGYENRLMTPEEFKDVNKDAGEIGAGHSITVLYEIIPNKIEEVKGVETKYIENKIKNEAKDNSELATFRIKYKNPDNDESYDVVKVISSNKEDYEKTSDDFKFAANVAIFGMYLRGSEFLPFLDFEHYLKSIDESLGNDKNGYRKEFRNIVALYLEK